MLLRFSGLKGWFVIMLTIWWGMHSYTNWNIYGSLRVVRPSAVWQTECLSWPGCFYFNCCISLLAAEASECGGGLRGWQEPAAGGGLSASRAAGASAELRDRRDDCQLSSSGAFLHHGVDQVCDERRPKVGSLMHPCDSVDVQCLTLHFCTQKRPASHPGVRNWISRHLCLLWSALQSLPPHSRLGYLDTLVKRRFLSLHCINPALFLICLCALGSVPKMNPRIASASLSQSPAVDETVLPAAPHNITAYAVNTQTPQG